MRIKEGYIVKKLGTGYVAVAVGDAAKEFNGVIRLNPAGEFLWRSIAEGADTREKLTAAMLERYEDLERARAEKDLTEFLDTVAFCLEE